MLGFEEGTHSFGWNKSKLTENTLLGICLVLHICRIVLFLGRVSGMFAVAPGETMGLPASRLQASHTHHTGPQPNAGFCEPQTLSASCSCSHLLYVLRRGRTAPGVYQSNRRKVAEGHHTPSLDQYVVTRLRARSMSHWRMLTMKVGVVWG